jgi:hypothetical protein
MTGGAVAWRSYVTTVVDLLFLLIRKKHCVFFSSMFSLLVVYTSILRFKKDWRRVCFTLSGFS